LVVKKWYKSFFKLGKGPLSRSGRFQCFQSITLALQFRRYPGSRICAFDMGRSMRATVLGLGGEHGSGIPSSPRRSNPGRIMPITWSTGVA
tara:strand:+ start:23725 stop:23997 length:273 start_codon:yes stop_codon:yes gene_type:complete